VIYVGEVKPNSFYPTYGSMFSLYLGLHDKTSIVTSNTHTEPTVKVTVAEQVIVSNKNVPKILNQKNVEKLKFLSLFYF
jgi:hypothetical protein